MASNPMGVGRPTYRIKIKHCRDMAPETTRELHDIAGYFINEPVIGRQIFGWQVLLQAFMGLRASEVVRLRWDAAPRCAGHIDGNHIWLERSKHGVNPFAMIHPALADCLEALKTWRDEVHPGSPWFLPWYSDCASDPRRLTSALNSATAALELPKRTSHGLRSFFVVVRRSQGICDGQIAAEIGDASGAKIITQVYGAIPPNWAGGKKLDWTPECGPVAWAKWAPDHGKIVAFPATA